MADYTKRLWVSGSRAAACGARIKAASRRHGCWRGRHAFANMPANVCACAQLEEDLADDLKWSMRVKEVMYSGKSDFQEVDLINTGPFGKVRSMLATVAARGHHAGGAACPAGRGGCGPHTQP